MFVGGDPGGKDGSVRSCSGSKGSLSEESSCIEDASYFRGTYMGLVRLMR